MVKEADELLALIAQSKLGGEVRDYINMGSEDYVDAKYSTNELVNIAMVDGLTPKGPSVPRGDNCDLR